MTKRATLNALGEGYDIRHVALSPSGRLMAWLAAPRPDARAGKCAVLVYDTATGKLLHAVKDLPGADRADLPDEGETLVLHPVRPAKVEKALTAQAAVVGIPDGRGRFHCAYRFRPATYVRKNGNWVSTQGRSSPRRIDKAAVRFRDSLLTFDEVGIIRWDRKTGQKLEEYNEPFSDFAVSADGRRIAVREDQRVEVSDGDLGPLRNNTDCWGPPYLRFLSAGRLVVKNLGRLQVWDPRRTTALESLRVHDPLVLNKRWDTDSWGKAMPSVQEKGIVVYDLVADRPRCPLDGVRAADAKIRPWISGDGKRVLVTVEDKDTVFVRWFDANSGRQLGRYEIPRQELHRSRYSEGPVHWFAEDGSVFGHITRDTQLKLVDCSRGEAALVVGLSVPDTPDGGQVWRYQSAGSEVVKPLRLCPLPHSREGFDRLGHTLAVLHALHLVPAAFLAGALGQVDLVLAVGRQRSAPPGAASRHRQAPQAGIPAQPAEHPQPQRQRRLEERPLGIGTIDRQPQGLARVAQPQQQPADQVGSQFQLGVEVPGVRLGQAGHVLGADVQQGVQRQGQGVPQRVPHHPSQGDPDVAVAELLASWPRAGVVVDAGALHVRTVAGGRGIVEGEHQVVAGSPTHQRPQGATQQTGGQRLGATASGPEGAVSAAEGGGDAGGAQPAGDRAPAFGEQGAEEQQQQPRGGAAVESAADVGEPGGQSGGQVREWHGRLLGRARDGTPPSSWPGSRSSSTHASVPCAVTSPVS